MIAILFGHRPNVKEVLQSASYSNRASTANNPYKTDTYKNNCILAAEGILLNSKSQNSNAVPRMNSIEMFAHQDSSDQYRIGNKKAQCVSKKNNWYYDA